MDSLYQLVFVEFKAGAQALVALDNVLTARFQSRHVQLPLYQPSPG